ncbi:hypothetical protein J3R82DRAFT_7935 [Butyriboletus roseoflavus]|nr:hypothetical protein J3R82DRAFT_7935 [Butyriboletus roseoflavus]
MQPSPSRISSTRKRTHFRPTGVRRRRFSPSPTRRSSHAHAQDPLTELSRLLHRENGRSLPQGHHRAHRVHPRLLTDLGKLAASLPHISENRREVEDALRRFDAKPYAAIYDRFGLLRSNTILGHGVWLTEEMVLIAEQGAGSAFGMARVGLLLDHGIKEWRTDLVFGAWIAHDNHPPSHHLFFSPRLALARM